MQDVPQNVDISLGGLRREEVVRYERGPTLEIGIGGDEFPTLHQSMGIDILNNKLRTWTLGCNNLARVSRRTTDLMK